MNISTAFNNALSGLTAASRGASVVSDNIANALTPGYARRSVALTTSAISGHGVRIAGISRHAFPALTANRRTADADVAHAAAISDFYDRMEQLVGTADDPGSIASRISGFESSLISAASLPDSATRLDQAVDQARTLARSIKDASDGLRKMRSEADRTIGSHIEGLNATLAEIETLNAKIPSVKTSGGDINALLDQRQLLIDQVNELIPLNVVARADDKISLYSEGGLILLEGQAVEFNFATTGETMPHMTVDNGLLSGLEVNGQPIRTAGANSAIRGGQLAAQFEIRDDLAVEAQADLDAVARDLIERFETPGLDPTLAATDPGLFTDNGARFDPAKETGLAGRIGINSLVDPRAGGDSWKLRTGLGAAGPGEPGDASQLQAFEDVLTASLSQPTTRFGTGQMTAAEIGEALLSGVGQDAQNAAESLSSAATVQTDMVRIEAEQGVDTDAELQQLMRIEQAYAANARIIEVVDDLLQTLLRI